MSRRVFVALMVLVVGCASEPRPEPRFETYPTRQEREGARKKEDARKREEARAEVERQKAEQARNEEEWPEGRPVIFLRGEPAPVKTRTTITAPDHPPTESSSELARPSGLPSVAPEPARQRGPDLRSDAAEFLRLCDLLDKGALDADRSFKGSARESARSWTASRIRFVRDHPGEAKDKWIYEPSEREIQAHYDERLLEHRAHYIRARKEREVIDRKMSGVR